MLEDPSAPADPVRAVVPARAVRALPAEPALEAARTLSAARRAWVADDAYHALALLDGLVAASREQRVEAALLRARLLLAGGQPERVLSALQAVAGDFDGRERTIEAMLRGAALVALDRFEDGIALLRGAAAAGAGGPQRAEAVCVLADAYRRAGRLDEAEAVLAPALDARAAEPGGRAAALAAYGRLETARGRRSVAVRYLLDALTVLEEAAEPSRALRAGLLHEVVAIAVETLDPRLFARVRAQFEPGAAAARRVRVLGELLCGEVERAWSIAFEGLRAAPPGSPYVAALLDAAAVAAAAGDRFTPARLVLEAADVARDADWSALPDRGALLRAVVALAPLAARPAVALLGAYETLAATGDADERTARGLARAAVAAASGRPTDAVALLRSAAALAQAGENRHAEVEALLALGALAADEPLLQRADELTRLVPRSSLRRRYEALAQRARGLQRLSPAERRVLHAICEGGSTAEIAARFGRSTNTIRNQTRRVYELMGVRSRSALVAKCAALDLLKPAGG